jgi:formylglycine-generating enzyme required for sulfatase activity
MNSDGTTCSAAGICSLPGTPSAPTTSQAALVQSVVGQWALCDLTSFFGSHEAGLEIAADGSWHKLYDVNGALARGTGGGDSGTWQAVGATQIEFTIPGAGGGAGVGGSVGFVGGIPVFSTNPAKMHFDNNGVFAADYVRAACPPCTAGACLGACGTPGQTRCMGNGAETCGLDGLWTAAPVCATDSCLDGACAGATTTGTSCPVADAGPGDCGPSGDSCCTSPEVAGGTYFRTYDPSYFNCAGADGGVGLVAAVQPDGGPTGELDPASVSAFRLDKYDVTVGRFRQFVSAWTAGFRPPAGSGKHTHLNGGRGLVDVSAQPAAATVYETGWRTPDDASVAPTDVNLACDPEAAWTASAASHENLPVNCVNWYEAYAFCIWDGGFLPSEAEWGYAAAGGSEQRVHPWGSTDPATSDGYAAANVAPVGTATLGAGRWGQVDLVGYVQQWTLDSFAPYVDSPTREHPCSDCAYLLPGNPTFRGSPLTSSDRRSTGTTYRSATVGLRCARAP